MIRKLYLVIPLFLLLCITGASQALAAPTQKEYTAELYNSTINVQKNNTLIVTEAVTFHFTGGDFSFVNREIPTDQTDNLSIVSASVDDKTMSQGTDNGQYEVDNSSNPVKLTWHFKAQSDTSHTYRLTYRVQGVIQKTQQADLLDWYALPKSYSYPIQATTITVNYADPAQLLTTPTLIQGDAVLKQPATPGSVVYEGKNIAPDSPMEIGLQFKPGSLIQAPPAWQARQQETDTYSPVGWLGALGIGILVSLVAFFYKRGRQPKLVKPSIERHILSEPPYGLKPGIAGTLINLSRHEEAGFKQALGTLFDLANQGVVTIVENERSAEQEEQSKEDLNVELVNMPTQPALHEAGLLSTFFRNDQQDPTSVPFSTLEALYQMHAPQFSSPVRQELKDYGFLANSYQPLRKTLGFLAVLLLVLGVFGTIIGLFIASSLHMWPLGLLPLGLLVAGIVILIMRSSGRYYSEQGQQAIAECRAFNKYLNSLIHDEEFKASSMDHKQSIFVRYLPYATSFGWGQTWIESFQQMGITVFPSWFMARKPQYNDDEDVQYYQPLSPMIVMVHTPPPVSNYGAGSSADFGGSSFGGGGFGGGSGGAGGGSSSAG
ncbi:hypothetical protein KDA_11530 [Dictyobacter alpinus]|uniref:DUF2207 domain-containing protein n=1 Tax=Dictyobacter alpinus TaxID=2014873 RepID=A0A402B2U7_9CHLR|nr:DUF2207 domain-containing protein [Dictyobacter alpinus]GCE25669.1 hypothetical protein KDA_11530 [Dictyobacter alpinus]